MDLNVALSSPAVALTQNADTLYTFRQPVRHLFIQNNSATDATIDFDTAASSGSILLKAGMHLYLDIRVTVVHILSTAATNVNGASGSNIVLKGWV
jgi:hypothetical protein